MSIKIKCTCEVVYCQVFANFKISDINVITIIFTCHKFVRLHKILFFNGIFSKLHIKIYIYLILIIIHGWLSI